jgi:hypothetical protein
LASAIPAGLLLTRTVLQSACHASLIRPAVASEQVFAQTLGAQKKIGQFHQLILR